MPAPAGTGSSRASRDTRVAGGAADRRVGSSHDQPPAEGPSRQHPADRHERQQEEDVQTHPREVR